MIGINKIPQQTWEWLLNSDIPRVTYMAQKLFEQGEED